MADLILRAAALAALDQHAHGGGQTYRSITLEVAVEAIRALPAVAASQPADPAVKVDSCQRLTVKPLVWFEVERGTNGYGKWTAQGYTVRKIEGLFLLDFAGEGKSTWRFITSDEAKAAAQADYEARILAAIQKKGEPK